ncbi:MAG: PTS sugar transporter subunit IIC [Clostridiales bacterium]|nr:PTS sugar transporter subunit IIC [Clostridiales bacterium]
MYTVKNLICNTSGVFCVSILKKAYKRYLLDAMSAMAMGLFASLIIGSILGQLAKINFLSFLAPYSQMIGASSPVVGAAIGVAIGYGLKATPLALFSGAAIGALGYSGHFNFAGSPDFVSAFCGGGPLGAYIAAIVGIELGSLVKGKTKLDIIVVPIVSIVSGGLVAQFMNPYITAGTQALQSFLGMATSLQPVPMGIIISVCFGLALTAPISSAALAAVIFAGSPATMDQGLLLAAGAATVGCCCQMVGFAVSSFRENGMAGLVAQGVGTSMLQVGNILKRPAILVPATLTSAILGPIATTLLPMYNASVSAGMGTSGFVGQFGTWEVMAACGFSPVSIIVRMLILHIVLPAALSLLISEAMRRFGMIREGDMKLDL